MRFLIVKTSSLGDIIHVFPVVQYLSNQFPDCQIDWVVEHPFVELVQSHPLINRVFCMRSKKWRRQLFSLETWKEMTQLKRELQGYEYDIVFDLQGNTKSAFATYFARSPYKIGFSFFSVSEWPNLLVTNKRYHPPGGYNIREDYLFLVKNAVNDFLENKKRSAQQDFCYEGVRLKLSSEQQEQLLTLLNEINKLSGKKIIVSVGSNWVNKQLSIETLQVFFSLFLKSYEAHLLLIWGSLQEKEIVQQLHLAFPSQSSVMERLSLPVLQNLISHVDLVFAMDSLPLHLAGTTETATYSVFGPSLQKKYRPLGERHIAFQGKCPYARTFEKRCPILRTCKTGACMKHLNGKVLLDFFANSNQNEF